MQLIAKRDAKRKAFVQADYDTSMQFAPQHSVLKKQAKNARYFALYVAVGYGVLWLLGYKHIENLYVIIIAILLGLVVLGFIIKAWLTGQKEKFVYEDWQRSSAIDNLINDEAIALNQEIAKMAVGIICLSENFIELSFLNDQALEKRWKILIKEYIDVIDQEFNHRATIDDYIVFYERWERIVTERK